MFDSHLDPSAYGDFRLGRSRPRRIRDHCPDCGREIEWVDDYVDTGAGSEPRWIGASAECPCGLELRWCPDRHDRTQARRRAAIEKHDQESEAGQLRLV